MWAALRSVAELVKISAMVPAHSIPIWTRAAQVGISMRIFPGKEDDHRERQYDDHGHWAAYPLFRRDDLLADKPDTVRGEGMSHRRSQELHRGNVPHYGRPWRPCITLQTQKTCRWILRSHCSDLRFRCRPLSRNRRSPAFWKMFLKAQ